ncbi:MAG: hypothetical protein DRG78_11570 [Epsilonproteobacteria bacterium]|nr:MAG: hypothetical protein DRG78_11570 [Campylobacterota bacterium]
MPKCIKCKYVYSELELKEGYCANCITPELSKKLKLKQDQEKHEKDMLLKGVNEKKESIFITTETFIDLPIEKRVGIVSSQCIYGINIIKDIFNFVRDIVGGRIKSIESGLDEAKETILDELKEKAFLMGGDAVIGVKIEHTYNNANNGSILSVFGTGTVVILKKEE